ncbi:MAG: metallophosphoesterase [Alphaproteobacteria bacterium]|nr:metallophosphoesterase [Alphaproteobacteria bacterium]
MRTIAHLSDLHFGRTDPAVLESLESAVIAAQPHVVVVSGDLTQRARSHEFAQARDFLAGLPRPQIVVPGNHDVPFYNVLKRWLMPLSNFRRYIGRDLAPFHADEEIAVLGLNTARAFAIKNGRIGSAQVAKACDLFSGIRESALRIVVTHHPFAVPAGDNPKAIVGRAKMAMAAFADCKVDVVLSGHLHLSRAVTSETLFAGEHAALLVQAGTSSSTRRREEANAFNLLRVNGGELTVEQHAWNPGGFAVVAEDRFRRTDGGWRTAS